VEKQALLTTSAKTSRGWWPFLSLYLSPLFDRSKAAQAMQLLYDISIVNPIYSAALLPCQANHGKEQLSSMSGEPLFCTLPFKRCCTKQGEGEQGKTL
jgi:hypothetical protein